MTLRITTSCSASDFVDNTTLRTLDKGVYVLRVTQADGTTKSVKYVRP